MERLNDITVDDLHEALDSIDEKTPAQRLSAAIAYKNGIAQSELAEWFDVERKMIYNWLEERDLESAVLDEDRPGRPRYSLMSSLMTSNQVFRTHRRKPGSMLCLDDRIASGIHSGPVSISITHDRAVDG